MRIPPLVFLVGALAGVATANTHTRRTPAVPEDVRSSITFGHADKLTIERADLALTSEGPELRGTLRIELSTWDEQLDDRSILIGVPAGSEVSELRVTIAEEGYEAVAARPRIARSTYEKIVEDLKDPALLEWAGSSPQRTWLRLRVFPVAPDSPAMVVLGFTVPRTDSISIDPGVYRIANASVTVDELVHRGEKVETPLAIDLPPSRTPRSERTRPPFVSRKLSLVAGPIHEADIGEVPETLTRDPIITYF